jgi:hypothetical protein
VWICGAGITTPDAVGGDGGHHTGDAQPGKIVVLDRSGHPFGDGSFTNAAGASNLNVFADPTGTQWAWSVDDVV